MEHWEYLKPDGLRFVWDDTLFRPGTDSFLLSSLPKESDVDSKPLAKELAGRPLSDVSFVVREGARLAARTGKEKLDQASLLAALRSSPAREREGGETKRRIGFV